MEINQTNENEIMVTIHTIKNSPHVKPMISFIEKNKMRVQRFSVDKFGVSVRSIKELSKTLNEYISKIPKEMEISDTPRVGMTVFAYLQSGAGGLYIVSNERAHKKINKRKAKQLKMLM